jgi:mRNA interferase RelE/StbE
VSSPGPYRVEVSSEARRGLRRLPGKVTAAIVEFITGPLADDPLRLSKQLDELAAYRSARRGDYRVLIRVDDANRTILVARIDHRSDVYRPH